MVEIKVKHKQRETFEKRGVVFNAEQTRIRNEELELRGTKEFRDFGQVDLEDHEIEEVEKRIRKENLAIDKSKIGRRF